MHLPPRRPTVSSSALIFHGAFWFLVLWSVPLVHMNSCLNCLGMVLGRLPCRGAFKLTANCMSLKLLIWFLPIDVILLRSACLAYDAHMPSDVLHIQCHALVTNGLFLSAVLRSLGAFASLMPYSVFKCADFPWNLLFFGSLECATCTHN